MKKSFWRRYVIPVFVLLIIFISNTAFIDQSGQHNQESQSESLEEHSNSNNTNAHQQAEAHDSHSNEGGHDAHGKFEPGNFIFDHIGDSHEWHLLTVGEKHVSIYLPVILFTKDNGVVTFSSRKFHHGHESVTKNNFVYTLHLEGKYKGKITQTDGQGNISLPLDMSITKNIASLLFGSILVVLIFLSIASKYKKNPVAAPSGMQNLFETLILFVRDELAKPAIGHKYQTFMPFLLTVFFFIWINNMLGLVPIFPGGANLTGNIAITAVLAFFTFIITTIRGNKNYWVHIFNTPGVPVWLKVPIPIVPIVELLGIFIKPVVLMIRLFANITAGHIIAMSFVSLIFIFAEIQPLIGYGVSVVSVAFLIFMTLLELLVAFIQAYVFTFLSALYFGMAVEEHH